jgi:DNA polymerase-4
MARLEARPEAGDSLGGFCRDCLGDAGSGERCTRCASPRLVRHAEIDDLAIAHVDCDAFYAAIEKRDRPHLADRPVIVGGGRRGVVATACYIARVHGVHSAMPMFRALEACPGAVVIPPDMAKYATVARQVRAMMIALTPLVEPLSIDEAFLDLAGTGLIHAMSPARALAAFADRVERHLGITVSIGLSHNKFLAKIASDIDKPRGMHLIGRAETVDFLADQPVSIIWGVGNALQRRLAEDGMRRIADLRTAGEPALTVRYGAIGRRLAALAWGRDERPVTPERTARSISAETTFERDIAALDALEIELWRLCEKVAPRAKAAGLVGRTAVLKLKTAEFRLLTRQARPEPATQLAATLFEVLSPMLAREADGRRFRLIGAGLGNLAPAAGEDTADLFSGARAKTARLEAAMDDVRERFGDAALGKGRGFSPHPGPALRRSRANPDTRDP